MIKYDPHHWFDHFFDYHGSLVREITGRVLFFTFWAVCVSAFHQYVYPVAVPATVHSLIGVAFGLLLVFRTNSSYDRFWEGRKLWGGIVNETRNLIRSSEAYLIKDPETRKQVALWMIGFVYAGMNILRQKKDLGPVAKLLPAGEVEAALATPHPALYCAKQISLALQRAKESGTITAFEQITIDNNVQLLIDYIGGCERIHKTPLPFAYVVHLRRALVIYCLTLPFALLGPQQTWLAPLETFFLCYVFFGIEEIGVEIEDPFGEDENDLPLEEICGAIEKNTRAMSSVSF